jgi:hypothetical protein
VVIPMIDHAVLRELAAMLYEDAKSGTGENAGPAVVLADSSPEPDGKLVRRWYEPLLPRRTTII